MYLNIITLGASNGIGKEAAIHFSKLGASVCLVGRNAERLGKTLAECEAVQVDGSKQQFLTQIADVSKVAEVEAAMKATLDHFGKLNVLINNAGIIEYGTIETTSLEQYDRVMNTNLRAVYQFSMLAVPHLVQTKGACVCTGFQNI